MSLDQKLATHFEQFNSGHALAKQRLLTKLADYSREGQPASSQPTRIGFTRIAVAVAAVFVIGFGLLYFSDSGSLPVNPSAAWAEAFENTSQIHSVYLKATTRGSGVEMWWRQPSVSRTGYTGDYRMEFSNGNVVASNEAQHAAFDPKNNKLALKEPFPGLELMILGELGQLFGPNRSLSQNMLKDSVVISEETITYKGEECLVRLYENSARNQIHKCIVGLNPPLIYETETYGMSDPTKAVMHVEVLEVDKTYPDDLFTIVPGEGMVVQDRRVPKVSK